MPEKEVTQYTSLYQKKKHSWMCNSTLLFCVCTAYLYRRFHADADPLTLRHGCEVWDPYLVNDTYTDVLESVQQFAGKCLKQWHLEYSLMLSSPHIPSLSSTLGREMQSIYIPWSPIWLQNCYFCFLFYNTINTYQTIILLIIITLLVLLFPSTISFWNSLPFDITTLLFNSF